jgi:hypothetical protein
VKTTRYFEEQVLRNARTPREGCEHVIDAPLKKETQTDGRIRCWGAVPELDGRIIRVVTLADGETVHNAFPDRDFEA